MTDFDIYLMQQREEFINQHLDFQEYLSYDADAVVFTAQCL